MSPTMNETCNVTEYTNVSEYVLGKIRAIQNIGSQTVAQILEEKVLKFQEIPQKVAAFTHFLKGNKVQQGDVVCFCSKNTTEYCVWLLGCFHIGAVPALISPDVKPRELKHALDTFRPKWILSDELNNWQRTLLTGYRDVIVLEWNNNQLNGTRLMEAAKQSENDVGLILMSSGSTGLPKGVLLSHKNIIQALIHSSHLFHWGARALGLMPFFHAFGLILMLLALCEGTTLVIMQKFSPDRLIKAISLYKLTHLHLVPSLLPVLIKNGKAIKDELSSVKHIWTGAGLINPKYQESIKGLIDNVEVHHTYGMTETTFIVFHGTYRPDKPFSVGTLLPIFKCKIVDEEGKECKVREKGELCYKGPTVTQGYLDNVKATRETIDEEGWLHSGDLGFMDEDGYHYIVDRIKELIKYQGYQVSPSEIETVILTHKGVLDVGVIGRPHQIYGEVPMAFVVREGEHVTEEEIVNLVKAELSHYKQLRGGVKFVESIPRTGNGKIYRRELRDSVKGKENEI